MEWSLPTHSQMQLVQLEPGHENDKIKGRERGYYLNIFITKAMGADELVCERYLLPLLTFLCAQLIKETSSRRERGRERLAISLARNGSMVPG